MSLIRLLAAPIRSILRSRLFQLLLVVAIILFLENYSNNSTWFGQVSDDLDKVVDSTGQFFSQYFPMKTFTKSIVTVGLMIVYVYIVCLLALYVLRLVVRGVVDLVGLGNVFGLRNAIARERGIAAYRAWVPLERIRPASIPQEKWEAAFAWPLDNKPPYPPLALRLLRGLVSYVLVILIAAALLQFFTPFPVLSWIVKLIRTATTG